MALPRPAPPPPQPLPPAVSLTVQTHKYNCPVSTFFSCSPKGSVLPSGLALTGSIRSSFEPSGHVHFRTSWPAASCDVPLEQCPEKIDFRRLPGGQVHFHRLVKFTSCLQGSWLPATCSTICHRSSSLPVAVKLTSGYLFSNLSPVNFTSCYKEVDFRLPVQQSVTGQAQFLLPGSWIPATCSTTCHRTSSLPATGKLTSGHLFNNLPPVRSLPDALRLTSGYLFSYLSPVNFTSCYREVDFRPPVQQPATGKVTSWCIEVDFRLPIQLSVTDQVHFLLQGSWPPATVQQPATGQARS